MAEENGTEEVSAASRYEALKAGRTGPLERARKNARITLPWVVPPDGADETTDLMDPFQNVGTEGVKNLAAKMTLAVMPPNEPFFRHDADDFAADEMEEQEPGTKEDAAKKLARYDRMVMKRIEASGDRPKVELIMKHLLIAGNVLVMMDPDKPIRVIPLERYCVLRDPRGEVVELVMEEPTHAAALPDEAKAAAGDVASDAVVNIYTHIRLKDGMYDGFQEIEGNRIADSEFRKKPEDLNYIALRFSVVDGMSYGRSFVESVYGDLETLETLTQAITDAASMAVKVIFLVRPNGSTKVTALSNASNGDFVSGDANDISTLQLQKSADMQIAKSMVDMVETRLAGQFLVRNSATRDAERVTAEEIRYVALEIEDGLSGIYSLLSQEFQLPYVRLRIKGFKDLPQLPKDLVGVTITTGLEALRRGHDLQKLTTWGNAMSAMYGPQVVAQMVPPQKYGARIAAALGLDIDSLITPQEQVQQQQARQQITDVATQVAPDVIKGAMNG